MQGKKETGNPEKTLGRLGGWGGIVGKKKKIMKQKAAKLEVAEWLRFQRVLGGRGSTRETGNPRVNKDERLKENFDRARRRSGKGTENETPPPLPPNTAPGQASEYTEPPTSY